MNSTRHWNGQIAVARKPIVPVAVKPRTKVHSEEFTRQFAWVDWLLRKTALTDSSLARKAGLPVNAIYRKRTDESPLSSVQIRALMDATGMPGPDTYQMPGASGLLAEEAAPFESFAKDIDPVLAGIIAAALKDRPNAAPWRLNTRALEDAGYLVGDIVITDASAHQMAGDAVCAQVYDVRTGTAETVFRIFEAPYLVAATSEPNLRKPMLVDDNIVVVRGVITESFRARRR